MVYLKGGSFGDAPPPCLWIPEIFLTLFSRAACLYNRAHASQLFIGSLNFALLNARYEETFQLIVRGGGGGKRDI